MGKSGNTAEGILATKPLNNGIAGGDLMPQHLCKIELSM